MIHVLLPTRSGRRAFTLIEVMISVALVLGLIIGINQVFKVASDTVGTGMALSGKVRDMRAAQSIFYNEISHAVTKDAPFLIIDSRTRAAFMNARDRDSDLDFAAATTPAMIQAATLTVDLDGNNADGDATVPGERISPAAVNDRAHRVDTLSFVARDLFRRQTGNVGTYVDDMSSNEAWITYGHLRVFNQDYSAPANINTDAFYPFPGSVPTAISPNPKNYFADDWVLGRVAMLLVAPQAPTGSVPGTFANTIYDRNNVPQDFWFKPQAANVANLEPLGRNSRATNPNTVTISDARYDLAGTTIARFSQDLADYIERTKYFTGAAQDMTPPTVSVDDWWTVLPSDGSTATGRFRCNPYPVKPLDSAKAAQTAPIMLSNCTQFIVEYAGDFLTQDSDPTSATYGNIGAVGPDGAVDFYLETVNGVPYRRVRWYGFPRDQNGDGVIRGWDNTLNGPAAHNALVDVVPLRDVILSWQNAYYNNLTAPANKAKWNLVRFERNMALTDTVMPPTTLVPRANYADVTGSGVGPGEAYTCAWGPADTNKPTMIRIIVRVDDPNGRLSGGQTVQYVINLQ